MRFRFRFAGAALRRGMRGGDLRARGRVYGTEEASSRPNDRFTCSRSRLHRFRSELTRSEEGIFSLQESVDAPEKSIAAAVGAPTPPGKWIYTLEERADALEKSIFVL
jgi:hypothetical protein